MKTENRLEEKAKYFAQYWGQTVLSNGIELGGVVGDCEEHLYLSLTPLRNISDEDAIEVMKLQQVGITFTEHDFESTDLALSFRYKHNGKWGRYDLDYDATFFDSYQYLQSKGYLLPYRDLSVEELINIGWAKERNG